MPSTRPLPGTTNKGQTLGFHPGNHDSVLKGAPPTKKSSNAAGPTCGGYYYKSRTTRLTGTRARSGREHIPQAKSEQLPVKQSLHRIQDPAFVSCRSSNHAMAFSACVDPLEILVQTCPEVSTKNEAARYPGKASYADVAGVLDQPNQIKVSKERHIRQSLFSFEGEVRKSQMARLKISGSQLHELVSNETEQGKPSDDGNTMPV